MQLFGSLSLFCRGFVDVVFEVAQPRSLGRVDFSFGDWLVRKNKLPPVFMPYLNDTQDQDDFARGRALARKFIDNHLQTIVSIDR
jgi:hypothetical protein